MNLYLVRHGETSYNRDGFGLGRADVNLTDRGLNQAILAGESFRDLPLTRVVSSPLRRAATLAHEIAGPQELDVVMEPALTEMDVGSTEGMRFTEIREHHADFLREWASSDGYRIRMPGGGESIADVADRLTPFVESLRESPDENVVVVSHNFVIRVAICLLLDVPVARFRAFAVDLASISLIRIGKEISILHRLNDTGHLATLPH